MSFEYDVAISFLSRDEGLAKELRDRLSASLRVFLYTHRQPELAGTVASSHSGARFATYRAWL
jgi:hypothetical protein